MDWGSVDWASLISLVGSLAGDYLDDDYDNPYVKKALKRADYVSKHGYRPEILAKMRQNVNQSYGSEASAQRQAALQRMMRQNAPMQLSEQVVRDLTTALGGERMKALSNIDIANENAKMDAMRVLMGGANSAQTDSGWMQLAGYSLGSLLNSAKSDNSSTTYGGTTNFDTQKILNAISNSGGNYYTQYNDPTKKRYPYWTSFQGDN